MSRLLKGSWIVGICLFLTIYSINNWRSQTRVELSEVSASDAEEIFREIEIHDGFVVCHGPFAVLSKLKSNSIQRIRLARGWNNVGKPEKPEMEQVIFGSYDDNKNIHHKLRMFKRLGNGRWDIFEVVMSF